MTQTVYVGIGSNIEPRTHVSQALQSLESRYGPLTVSPVYTCPAVGFDGPPFLNLVVGFDTDSDAETLTRSLHGIEDECGRDRGKDSDSRPMDLDLLLYGDLIETAVEVRVPRSDILRYAFTLKPLADIAPNICHPTDGRTYAQLWAAFDDPDQPLERSDFQAQTV